MSMLAFFFASAAVSALSCFSSAFFSCVPLRFALFAVSTAALIFSAVEDMSGTVDEHVSVTPLPLSVPMAKMPMTFVSSSHFAVLYSDSLLAYSVAIDVNAFASVSHAASSGTLTVYVIPSLSIA